MRKAFFSFIHNIIAHPLLIIADAITWFHDWTADMMDPRPGIPKYDAPPPPPENALRPFYKAVNDAVAAAGDEESQMKAFSMAIKAYHNEQIKGTGVFEEWKEITHPVSRHISKVRVKFS